MRFLTFEVVFHIVVIAIATVIYLVAAEYEAFELFYEYSRAHEDWDLDEAFAFIIVGFMALFVLTLYRTLQLRKAVRDYRSANDRAESLALHDPLTGLPNRRALFEFLETVDRGTLEDEVAILLIDLDRFKPINDVHGHAAGDEVLRKVAECLRTESAANDYPARLGGDEFAVVLRSKEIEVASIRFSRRIIHQLGQPLELAALTTRIGASIGIAVLKPELDPSEALRLADQAMYSAKRNGRGKFAFYDRALDDRVQHRTMIELEMREAEATGQFVPYFQPVVDIATGRVKGFEVLARWQHPERGLMTPDQFIDIAEDIGVVGAIGMEVLRRACEEAKNWSSDVFIAFNVSPKQFSDPNLEADLLSIIEDTGIDPRRLELELTENSVITDLDAARLIIARLKALGICVALDDFGVGFSSLASLRLLPFDRLKIDKSFVTDIEQNSENQKIMNGVLSLAESFDLSVTVEGVESDSDLKYFGGLHCQFAQGYLFSKPISAKEAAWFIETSASEGQQSEPTEATEDRPQAFG